MNFIGSILSRLKKRLPSWATWLSAIAGLLLLPAASRAQTPLSNLVFTVGTTIQGGSTNWSYLLIGSEEPALLAGKRFDIFGKPGTATNAGTYTLRSTLVEHTDATTINTLLSQSLVLRENLTTLSNALNVVLHSYYGATNFTLAQKIGTAFQIAAVDPNMLETISLLSHNHPGLSLCAGLAFAEPITSVTTYEVREVNPADGSAGEVIGRITVYPGNPVVLPAPGFPYQISTNLPVDNLRIRLRWGTPP